MLATDSGTQANRQLRGRPLGDGRQQHGDVPARQVVGQDRRVGAGQRPALVTQDVLDQAATHVCAGPVERLVVAGVRLSDLRGDEVLIPQDRLGEQLLRHGGLVTVDVAIHHDLAQVSAPRLPHREEADAVRTLHGLLRNAELRLYFRER